MFDYRHQPRQESRQLFQRDEILVARFVCSGVYLSKEQMWCLPEKSKDHLQLS